MITLNCFNQWGKFNDIAIKLSDAWKLIAEQYLAASIQGYRVERWYLECW